jgi:hypothetical protein
MNSNPIGDLKDGVIVKVGYFNSQDDQTRPIKFNGILLLSATNCNPDMYHPNHNRFHKWLLYEVKNGYRVVDQFISLFPKESNHTGLSAVLDPPEVSKIYPVVANAAMDAELWTLLDVVCQATDNEETGKPASVEYKYEQKDFEEK